jgi:hypothetical protein
VVTVTAVDSSGNVDPTYTGTVHFTSSDAQAVLPADYAFTSADAGMHNFSVTFLTAGSQALTATDTVTAAVTGSQTGIIVNPAAASTLVLSGFPAQVTAGTPGNLTVTAEDAYGNTATGYTGTVTFISSDTQADLPADYTFTGTDAGVHNFSATLKTATESNTLASLTATDTVTASITGSLTGLTVNPAAATSLAVAGYPSPAAAGQTSTVIVAAVDPYGNIDTNYAGTVTLTSSDPLAALPPDTTFDPSVNGGVAFLDVTLNTQGTQSITATDTADPSITGSQTGIQVGPASASSDTLVVAGFPAPVTAGTPGVVRRIASSNT